MERSTNELTIEYIKENPHIKNCLKKGLINYSALARLISKELKLEKKSSKEAILIAARRFKHRLSSESGREKKIKALLNKSEFEIKNKIVVLIFLKWFNPDFLTTIQKEAKEENILMYFLEGTDNYTIITKENFAVKLAKRFKRYLVKEHHNLAMIIFKSPEEIEKTIGVISYLTSLFGENGVNIVEFLSFWRDSIFIISKEDVKKTIEFLNF